MSGLDVAAFLQQQTNAVREAIGAGRALIATSGGVDSTVSAVITHRAIGNNLVCVFIDDNFMRLGEPERVKTLLSSEPLSLPVSVLNARERFIEALEGLSDAEEKRKAFRETFYQTLSEFAKESGCDFLVQGTIRADVEETAGGIKTQHNVLEQVGINPVEKYGFRVVEPIASLYKHQVREVARYLRTPPELSERQPFPGPGLAIRVVGEITPEKLEELKKATFIVEEGFEPHGPSQYFAAIFSGEVSKELKALRRDVADVLMVDQTQVNAGFLAERATGIEKEKRAYGSVAILGVTELSGRPFFPGYDKVVTIREHVRQNYPEVTRLLYLVQEREEPGYALALRAVKTRDFLTAEVFEIPWSTLTEVASKIMDSCPRVSRVYYDVTPKPPATIEFE